MTDPFNFSRSYTYKEQTARSLTWGHHFLLLNILLAIFVGTAYVYAAPQSEGFLAFAYLILTLCGHMSFICCVIYLIAFFPLSFIGNFRVYRIISVVLAVLLFTLLLVDVKLYLYVKVHLGLGVLRLIFTQLDFNTGLNYNFLFIAVPLLLVFELCFAKISTAYVYSYKGVKLIFIRALIALLTICFISSHCIHIWADAVRYQQVTVLKSAFPAHYPMTAKNFLESHGWLTERKGRHVSNFSFVYPLEPVETVENPRLMNTVTVLINGISQQDLNAADCPQLFALKGQAISFDNNYLPYTALEDNLFAASYGLPRQYRQAVQANRVLPVVLTEMFRQDYLIRVLQSNCPKAEQLPQPDGSTGLNPVHFSDFADNAAACSGAVELLDTLEPGQRFSLTLLLNDLQKQQGAGAFASALKRTDAAVGALIDALRASGRMQDTVIMVTAMAGRQQAAAGNALHYDRARQRVPLLLWLPGSGPQSISALSSPFDIAPTLGAQAVGISSAPSTYAIGYDLSALPQRDFIVSDSNDIMLIGRTQTTIYLDDGQALIERASGSSAEHANLASLISAMRELNRFQE